MRDGRRRGRCPGHPDIASGPRCGLWSVHAPIWGGRSTTFASAPHAPPPADGPDSFDAMVLATVRRTDRPAHWRLPAVPPEGDDFPGIGELGDLDPGEADSGCKSRMFRHARYEFLYYLSGGNAPEVIASRTGRAPARAKWLSGVLSNTSAVTTRARTRAGLPELLVLLPSAPRVR